MIDKIFWTQLFFSVVAVSFAMTMIAVYPTPESTSIYLPILTGILSTWLPGPQNKPHTTVQPDLPQESIDENKALKSQHTGYDAV
jgi:hypothetical protein